MDKHGYPIVYVVYVAGLDRMEMYKCFDSAKRAIECAETLKKTQRGSVTVYAEQRIF